MLNVNQIYADWTKAPEPQKAELQLLLRRAMRYQAAAVCTRTLGNPISPIIDLAVDKGIDKLHTFQGKSKFSTWFHRLATNLCIDSYRRRKFVPLKDIEGSFAAVDSKILLDEIRNHLDVRELQLLEAKLEEASNSEIARNLNLSRERVGILWKRLSEKIRTLTTQKGGDVVIAPTPN